MLVISGVEPAEFEDEHADAVAKRFTRSNSALRKLSLGLPAFNPNRGRLVNRFNVMSSVTLKLKRKSAGTLETNPSRYFAEGNW